MACGDETDRVRHGYDAVSYRYRADDAPDGQYAPWLAELRERVPVRGSVLDLGCGCGLPVARFLVAGGYRLTGVDFSEVQIERARRLVPDGRFVCADAAQIQFPVASFDAVVCLYALIHMPLCAQPLLMRRVGSWLRPGGWLLATVGQSAWTGTERNWLDGPAEMWWDHASADTYRAWIEEAGLRITREEFVPEGDGGHALFWAHA